MVIDWVIKMNVKYKKKTLHLSKIKSRIKLRFLLPYKYSYLYGNKLALRN